MAKRKTKKNGFVSLSLVLLGFAIGVAVVFALFKLGYIGGPVQEKTVKYEEEMLLKTPEPPGPQAIEEPALPKPPLPKVAIVIDDMGQDMGRLKDLFAVGGPVTVAVIPHLRFSKEVALQAHSRGWDVILHLPMEPKDIKENDPGEGALFTAMTPADVKAVMEKDLKSVPNAIGVNNHMGSRFTEDERLMRAVLELAGKKGLIFLDSRTSSNSVGGRLARELGVASAERNVFLDNTRDVSYIKGQISELMGIARKKGKAIGIGHPYPETIAALKESVPVLDEAGVELVGLSELIEAK